MRELVVALGCALLVAGLAGCIGSEGAVDPASEATTYGAGNATEAPRNTSSDVEATNETTPGDEEGPPAEVDHPSTTDPEDPNPWQRGLDEDYPTPDVAKNRSADERRANVAEPGHPEFAAFDATVRAWMAKHNITAGQLALMKDGQLRYTSGYGHVGRAESQPTDASTMFRIASVTKPMTEALVSLQVEQGLYNWTDPVFCLGEDPAPNCRLPLDPHPANPVEDERLEDITVRHLVEHRGGWGETAGWISHGEGALQVAEEMGIDTPPPAWRTGQYLMGEPLVHDPGEERRYCNVCYLTAGLVAEAATGAKLGALYDAYLFDPLEVPGDIEPGRALPEDRNPREPFYHCEFRPAQSVFDPNETVCPARGGWSLQTQLAQGGLVATAEAVGAVYEAYGDHAPEYVDGCPPDRTCRGHTGKLPGTGSGVGLVEGDRSLGQFVFLFNSNKAWEGCGNDTIQEIYGLLPNYRCDAVDDLQTTMWSLTSAWTAGEDAAPTGATPS